jgi:manganese transport protein
VVLSMQLGFAVWPLMRFTSERAKMGPFVNGPMIRALGWTVTLVIITLNVKLLFDMFAPEAVQNAVYGLVA